MSAGYYLLTLVFHDQGKAIAPMIEQYQQRLNIEGLPDIPFHAVDLLHGHGDYANLDPEIRKRLLVAFSMFVRTLPISYHSFSFGKMDASNKDELQFKMQKKVESFLLEHLDRFQEFDKVPIYYDGGHQAATHALHEAFDFALTRDVAEYKTLSHHDKRLAQAADYLCTIELASKRYDAGKESATYRRFFGTKRKFKQNFLKAVKRKCVD